MNVKNIEKEGSKAKITLEIERDLMDAGANKAYLKARKEIQRPGFRKGKAPRKLIESIYGAHVFYEDGLEEIFPQVYQFAVVEQELKAVGRPSLLNMDIAEDGSATIVLETDLYPEVTLGQYKGLEVEKVEPTVTDDEVEAELDRMAKNVASRETVERPAESGDTANIDFEGFENGVPFEGGKGEGFDLVLGSGSFIPGFEAQVVGMSAGEEKDLDVTFPEDYHAKELAGKPVVFHVKVNSITVVSEFDTLDELRADIRTKELAERSKAVEQAFETAAVEKAAENATMELPESLVEEELDRQMNNFAFQLQNSGMSIEQYAKMMGGDLNTMRKAFRPAAEKQARAEVTLRAIIEAEHLEVSEEEVEAEYQNLADAYHMELERVKALAGVDSLRQDLQVRKAVKLIAESAVAVQPKAEEASKTEE